MNGVIYYNFGTSCCVRLLVSISSLRKVYSGNITILSEGKESHPLCDVIAREHNADVLRIDLGIPDGNNKALLAKPKIFEVAPYDNNLWIDADTLVLKNFDEIFDVIAKHTLVLAQFSNWICNNSVISDRIRQWSKYFPSLVAGAMRYGPAINCGVVGFQPTAEIFKHWYGMAEKGREFFIADEACMQLLLPYFQHKIVDPKYNTSCKFGVVDDDTRIIHYHGRKHCRVGSPVPFNGDLWLKQYRSIIDQNLCSVKDWTPAGDKVLGKYLHGTV